MKNPFSRSQDYPKNEAEEKWNFVGFFQASLLFFILLMPLFLLAGQLREVVELSTTWFALLLSMVMWSVSYFFTLRWWIQLSHNFGLMMYRFEQASEKAKKAKLMRLQPKDEMEK